ncbi:hypothetical protein [Chitinimonas sp. BJB300]|uniref:hypothetical protein n=1 Tax=Chitinimonas sp. BJB300 TaxID=1559339 RepID=UPI000C0C67EE|nr:hypothetical protein [Chitinimonas sp. BJB300]PHV13530.1 hypothetical protein CSQ89_00405 [Chitinimonas sp. BJB300]TSJ89787.1 hypothetical protein FG002_006135 [Chitinimonas sp. BJB300]
MSKGIKPIWWAALLGIGGLAWWSNQLGQSDTAIELKQPTAEQSTPANTSNSTPATKVATPNHTEQTEWFDSLIRDTATEPASDPFRSAKPASSTPPAPPPPPPPTIAPPTITPPIEANLPFQYLGKMERDGKLDIYLDLNGNPLVAHLGDTLPDGWRLERLDNAGLNFTHLATQRTQVLPLGAIP